MKPKSSRRRESTRRRIELLRGQLHAAKIDADTEQVRDLQIQITRLEETENGGLA